MLDSERNKVSGNTKIKVAVVQPSVPDSDAPDAYVAEGLRLTREAAGDGAAFICLLAYAVFDVNYRTVRVILPHTFKD
ncbi:MAG: hypothetical protein GXP32_04870 [Kiritimatiellaeota bacterium]|nr:hypothetical protein [Kiritimatiellota bacterium]